MKKPTVLVLLMQGSFDREESYFWGETHVFAMKLNSVR